MRVSTIAFATVLATSIPVHADDLLSDPTYDWTGFSVGVFGGGQWSSFSQSELFTEAFGGSWYFPPGPNPDFGYNDSSILYGIQADWTQQKGSLVYGVGAEVGSMNISLTEEDPNSLPIPIPGPGGPVTDLDAGFFGSVTGRLGVASDRLLFYIRGGLALMAVDVENTDVCGRSFCGQITIDAKASELLPGLTFGAGIEYAISEQFSAGIEYRAYSFSDFDVSGVASNLLEYEQTVDPDIIHTARLTLNYKF